MKGLITDSERFWEERYANGGNSGPGSAGKLAEFKAKVINDFIAEKTIKSVIEFGCGDGNQLALANYPSYRGFDVSGAAITLCMDRFSASNNMEFHLLSAYNGEKADVALSLDVAYHLVEDHVFEAHMRTLFGSANQYVIIYSSDTDENQQPASLHVRHRRITEWIHKFIAGWKLFRHIPNKFPYRGDCREGSFASFFIYSKSD